MPAAGSKPFTIGAVFASTQRNDLSGLDTLFDGGAWKRIPVSTCGEAVQAIRRVRMPIVLCDIKLENQPWKITLRKLRVARSECGVALVSNEIVPNLGREIAECLLVRLLERELVLYALFLAYGRCLSRLAYAQDDFGQYVLESVLPARLRKRNATL